VKYLVDSNVLSEITKPAPDQNVVDWLREQEAELVLNPIVLGEIEYGILQLEEGRQRRLLQQWFKERVQSLIVLDFDAATGSEWAQLLLRLKQKATPMPIKDSMIAASALRHGLTVATRNTVDFRKAGVPILNPFEPQE
jgi:predicted nucleic acid-binding protein